MNIYDVFSLLEQFDIKAFINGEVVNFYDMKYGSIMLIHENESKDLPIGKLSANSYFTIYSEESNKMIKIFLGVSKVDNESLIVSRLHYDNSIEEHIVDLERFGITIHSYKKEYDSYTHRDIITIRDNDTASFNIDRKVGFYNKQFIEGSGLSTDEMQESINSNKILPIMVEYYSKLYPNILETYNNIKHCNTLHR